MAQTTYLEVIGSHGPNGWQNPDTAQEFFNDRVHTPYGMLGKLKSEFENEFPVIVQADELVLIRRGFPNAWGTSTVGVTVEDNPFGFQVFELIGKNGMVRYKLIEDHLEWKDPPKHEHGELTANEKLEEWQLGQRAYSKWEPVYEPDPQYRSETKTTVIQEAS